MAVECVMILLLSDRLRLGREKGGAVGWVRRVGGFWGGGGVGNEGGRWDLDP